MERIPLAPGDYAITRKGRVFSFISNRWLKPSTNRDGYKRVVLRTKDGLRTLDIHRLVLETFVGPCPEGHVACHKAMELQNATL